MRRRTALRSAARGTWSGVTLPRAEAPGAWSRVARSRGRPGAARALARAACVCLVAAAFGVATGAGADPVEPPPDAPEGVDYTLEPSDSLESGTLELGLGAEGRLGEGLRRRRRMRFSSDGMSGTLHEGVGDPLSGAAVELRGLGGRWSAGRLAPRWGRGLLLGATAEPWARTALATESHPRARSGEGVWYRRESDAALGLMAGRFARRQIAGANLESHGLGVGALATGPHRAEAALWCARGAAESEIALDRIGRWRAEATLSRPIGSWRLAGGVRGGHPGYRPLAEPRRAGPARSLALSLARASRGIGMRGLAALWRFAPGVTGARAALEVDRRLAQHGGLAAGFEEQRGLRRLPAGGVSAARGSGFRQGLWGEWRAGTPELSLALRHEAWGERPWARGSVREVSAVRVEARAPAGALVQVTHSVYRVRRGESLYLPEAEADRLVLRAVSGAGERTRVEIAAPAAGGRLRAALNVTVAAGQRPRPQWTVDWTRRARTR